MRILVLCYSQSGDVAKITKAFCEPLKKLPELQVVEEQLRPNRSYPFPWGNLHRLLSVFPECQLGLGNGIKPFSVGQDERFDLIILAFQVWHLTPSLPAQDLFKSEYAGLLKHTPVVTVCVSRKAWHSGSERMKQLLRTAEAIHLDNVVVTHQGSALATLVSVPRLLLFGKRDRLWGIFPAAEISANELARLQRLGEVLAQKLRNPSHPRHNPLLRGHGAVYVNKRLILAELAGAPIYLALARFVRYCEKFGHTMRELSIFGCTVALVVSIITLMPLTVLITFIAYPFLSGRLKNYAIRLAEPSGEEVIVHT